VLALEILSECSLSKQSGPARVRTADKVSGMKPQAIAGTASTNGL